MFLPGVSGLVVNSEEWQATLETWGPSYHPVVGKFVQDSNQILRLIGDDDGQLKPNGLRICNGGVFWWDDVPYLPCPVAEFRIVPL